MKLKCPNCGKEGEYPDRLSFRTTCVVCGIDLHTCRYCKFYSPYSYNSCIEPQAEFVSNREKNNYCEYFQFNEKWERGGDEAGKGLKDLRKLFDD